MPKHPDDDLFAKSTMSIGDHLEELRAALFRSVIGLMIGFAIGMIFANWVVQWIKSPLSASLENYYINKSIMLLADETGDPTLKDMQNPTPMHKFIRDHRLVYENHYVEVDEVERIDKLYADYVAGKKVPAKSIDEVVPDTRVTPTSATTTAEKPLSEPKILGPEKLPIPGDVMMVTRVWKPIHSVVKALNAQEVFMIWMKAGLVVGAIFSSPYVFLQVWNFVAAGLYPHEKRYVHLYLPFSLGLFLFGAGLCFYFVIPQVLNWLLDFNRWLNIDPDPRISEWIGFVLFLPLGFGISFQLPLVMLLLNRIGIFSVTQYLAYWRIAILVIFVISMVLTPADPVSMLFMAIPLTFLYFLGIGMCRWMPRGQNPFDAAYEP
jgi:sec-independent protein translocase protein TatC